MKKKMLQAADIMRSLINLIRESKESILKLKGPCDERKDIRTFCDNRNDRSRMQHGKTARKKR